MKCPICGCSLEQARMTEEGKGVPRQFATRETYLVHCQSSHPDFLLWEKSKAKMFILLGVATAIPVSVASFWLLLFVLHAPSSAGRAFAFIPIAGFLLPGALFVKLGTRKYRRDWEARGGLQAPSTTSSVLSMIEPTYENEDLGILAVLGDVANELGLNASPASSVGWQTMVPLRSGKRTAVQMVPSDGCLFQNNTVYFAENMKGKLSPEDWKPILASVLIYKSLRRQLARGIVIRLLPLLAAYIIAWFIVPPLFPTTTYYSPQGQQTSVNNNGWIILIFAGIGLLILTIPIGISYTKKIKLLADRRAGALVGTSEFVITLNKLRQANPWNAATIDTRIRNLNGTTYVN
jgi:hypothetical protein